MDVRSKYKLPEPKTWAAIGVTDLDLLGFLNEFNLKPEDFKVLHRKQIKGAEGSILLVYNSADE